MFPFCGQSHVSKQMRNPEEKRVAGIEGTRLRFDVNFVKSFEWL